MTDLVGNVFEFTTDLKQELKCVNSELKIDDLDEMFVPHWVEIHPACCERLISDFLLLR